MIQRAAQGGTKDAPTGVPVRDKLLWTLEEVVEMTGFGAGTIRDWANDPASGFPKPKETGLRRKWHFLADEIRAWTRALRDAS